MPSERRVCQGMVERIGTTGPRLIYSRDGDRLERELVAPDHPSALDAIVSTLLHPDTGVLESAGDIAAVGHRVVHGGARFNQTTVVNKEVKKAIGDLSRLAPLHNPHNLEGIELAEQRFPAAVQVAVFDTAFHRSIPEYARRYAIPPEYYEEHGIQVYGFHGTSHKYVSERVKELLPPDGKLISLHLGSGCSATAIRGGKSLDHSLGFTPSGGLVMGSRSGDIDHGIIFYLMESLGYSMEQVKRLLSSGSGLKGLTGMSDLRDIESAAAAGDADCRLALEITAYRIRKYIGAYTAVLNGLDGLLFTAGIGENSATIREMVCRDMEAFGIRLDASRNQDPGEGLQALHHPESRVAIWVVPTDEELEIARQTAAVL